MILGIVAMDDALSLLLFALASSVAAILMGHGDVGLLGAVARPLYEIGGALAIGAGSGFCSARSSDDTARRSGY